MPPERPSRRLPSSAAWGRARNIEVPIAVSPRPPQREGRARPFAGVCAPYSVWASARGVPAYPSDERPPESTAAVKARRPSRADGPAARLVEEAAAVWPPVKKQHLTKTCPGFKCYRL